MERLEKGLWNSSFSHIYVEREVINHKTAKRIISMFNSSSIIEINHYKDMFCRSHQNFALQKNAPKLILAAKKDNYIYEGSPMCDDFGNDNFYYTSSVMNCIYNCEYCYLQGMYPSANIVIFVNIEDTIQEVERILKEKSMYLCVSYDTDLMSLENITGFVHKWLELTEKHKNLKIEIRTKSSNFSAIRDVKSMDNAILAWTLSPDLVAGKYEKNTPGLQARLSSIVETMKAGWKVRLCFDPLLYISDWQKIYGDFVDQVFSNVDSNRILDVSIGVFRVSKEYMKKIKKINMCSELLAYPYETVNGVCSYNKKHSDELINYVVNKVEQCVPKEKVFY
ncbi:SPL family radical SAM protein [Clostridium oryzae]|uniref:Spore photoproduct lyase n=1 Tax=Clostridium oryzae TaxID=1450648 RepID=A0A1V4IQU4_9CLOT|nr:DNA repair photolyase [Clostridium oryzae]OPJ62273.1 spore photoproduct lyase [Clostridium oryzae]